MAQLPKGGLVRGHDKQIHGSRAIYFPGGISCMFGHPKARLPMSCIMARKYFGNNVMSGLPGLEREAESVVWQLISLRWCIGCFLCRLSG